MASTPACCHSQYDRLDTENVYLDAPSPINFNFKDYRILIEAMESHRASEKGGQDFDMSL